MTNEAPQSLWQQVHGTLGKIQERHAANIDIYTYYRYDWFEAWYESAMEVLHDMDPNFLRTFYGIAKPAAPEGECKRDDEPDVQGAQQQVRQGLGCAWAQHGPVP